uniref:RGR-like protein n=1 Tax=Tanypteryx pryeri TaxID=126203 RepID=A0A0C6FZ99_TANPR|nr:opsin, RGR-like [Tanypteryx pryeri]
METPSLAGASQPECPWTAMEMQYLTWLGAILIVIGILGSAANGMLSAGCLLGIGIPENRGDQGHRLLLLNLSIASLGTLLLAGFPFTGPSLIQGRWIFGNSCCQLFAFLRQMFGFAQLAALMLLVMERYWLFYVITKENSRMMTIRGCAWGIASFWALSMLIAIPPLVRWGRYACDSTRTICELDWLMTNGSQISFNLFYLAIGVMLPTFVIFFCLWRTHTMIKALSIGTNDFGMDALGQYFITKVVMYIVMGMYLAWLPQAITVFSTMLLGNKGEKNLPVVLKMMSPIFSEVSTIVPIIVYAALGRHVRQTMLGILRKRNPPKSKHGMIRLHMKS